MRSVGVARRLSAIVALAAVVGVLAVVVVVLARHLLELLAVIACLSVAVGAAAVVPTPGWSTITALLQTAAGRPVTIQP
jgi:hypothetical protein